MKCYKCHKEIDLHNEHTQFQKIINYEIAAGEFTYFPFIVNEIILCSDCGGLTHDQT